MSNQNKQAKESQGIYYPTFSHILSNWIKTNLCANYRLIALLNSDLKICLLWVNSDDMNAVFTSGSNREVRGQSVDHLTLSAVSLFSGITGQRDNGGLHKVAPSYHPPT